MSIEISIRIGPVGFVLFCFLMKVMESVEIRLLLFCNR